MGNVSDVLSASRRSVPVCFQAFHYTVLGEMKSGVLPVLLCYLSDSGGPTASKTRRAAQAGFRP